jgi:CheY-like chemotaxis protein
MNDVDNGTRPTRVLIIDDHEISRGAYRALLRTEGLDVVGDVGVDGRAVAAARVLRPDVAIVDVGPAAATGFGIADELLALPAPPVVLLTSSAEAGEFGAQLSGRLFVGKAGLCAAAISSAARLTEGGVNGGHDLPRLVEQGAEGLAHGVADQLGEAVGPDRVLAGQPAVEGKPGDLGRGGLGGAAERGAHVGVDEPGQDDRHRGPAVP